MKKITLTIVSIIALGSIVIFGAKKIYAEQIELRDQVYQTLEKDELTEDEMDFINVATDPDEMKECFIALDDEHRALFKKHFGHDR